MKGGVLLVLFVLALFSSPSLAEDCDNILSYWWVTGETGYSGLDADCDWIKYDDEYFYASCSGIPSGYTIGPWQNPNIASDNDYIFRFPLNPEYETGENEVLPLGPMAVLVNGVPLFSATSAFSYNDKQIWWVNALTTEVFTMDDCMGHPAGTEYHHHSFPICMFEDDDGSSHSPLYGFAFDGYPIYGPYGYSDPEDSSSSVERMISGYTMRDISDRTSLADGTTLSSSEYGPDIDDDYFLGYYLQDYEWLETNGDLDEFNGRYTVTPEYPDGTYAYFFTIDENGDPEFPYIMNVGYKGVIHGSTVDNRDADVPGDAVEFYTEECSSGSIRVLISGFLLTCLLFLLI